MRKMYSPICLWFHIYLLESLVFEAYLLCIFSAVSSAFSKTCYKNDAATPKMKYRQFAQLMSEASRDLSSLHSSDLEVILFLCCQLKYSLWDAEHLWQPLSTSLEVVLGRISPLTEFFLWKILSVSEYTNVGSQKTSASSPLQPWKGSSSRSSVDIIEAAHFLLNIVWLWWVV